MGEDVASGAAVVEFEYDGRLWQIPGDLLELQRAWYAADGACQALALADPVDAEALRAARAHRLDLTDNLVHHPWLLEHQAAGRRHQADTALKACARQTAE